MKIDNNKIQIKNLSKIFKIQDNGQLLVLDDITFSLKEGGFYSLLGPSGCGKTTLLNIIAGIEKTTKGSVEINSSQDKHNLSLVYQQNDLLPWLSVENNLRLGLKRKGYSKKRILTAINSRLKEVDLEGFNKFYPSQLSGGMQKRVSLARALSVEPELILMDEPFAFLDFQTRIILQELIVELYTKEKKTIFFVTHNIPEAIKSSQKVIILTALPAKIKAVVDIPFTYPRNVEELKLSKEYLEIIYRISSLLKDEIIKTKEREKQLILKKEK